MGITLEREATRNEVAEETRRRLEHLTNFLGNNRVASLLNVSRSQPSRWRRGQEGMSSESSALVLDLDYVLTRFRQVYDNADLFWTWLNSENPFVGARAIDAITQRGPQAVMPAVEALAEGAYV
jgi:hypothetical protein